MLRSISVAVGMLCLLVTATNAQETRTIDGSFNNVSYPEWGATHSILSYWTNLDYADGISEPKLGAEHNRPNPRYISNEIFTQNTAIPDELALSDYLWSFGQFIDHDISLMIDAPTEVLSNIVVPSDDMHFTPGSVLPMSRSEIALGTGTGIDNPRRHVNRITAFLDGSAIYGSDIERASWLRGENGKLKVSPGNLLPWNTIDGDFNGRIDSEAPNMADYSGTLSKYYVAGDIRANENPLLIGFHTLFVREHNRLVDVFATEDPTLSGDELYEKARKKIGAYIQSITYNEWLPAMGVVLPKYSGYNDQLNPSISNVFSAAAFKLEPTLINSSIMRVDNKGLEIGQGNISLKDAYFNPFLVSLAGGIEPYFKGMGIQVQQELDCKVVNDVRNFRSTNSGAEGFDLAAISINRGRERGLGGFNHIRQDLGLTMYPDFETMVEFSDDAETLRRIYGELENVDPWVGMLAEKKLNGALFGETMMKIIERQFQALRDGDRFFYKNDAAFSEEEIAEIDAVTLYDILTRNTELELMQPNLFTAMPHEDIPNGPTIEPIDFESAAYPNPSTGLFSIKLYSEKDRKAEFSVYDANGRVIQDISIDLLEGDNVIPVDLSRTEYIRGLYNAIVRFGDKYSVVKLIKE